MTQTCIMGRSGLSKLQSRAVQDDLCENAKPGELQLDLIEPQFCVVGFGQLSQIQKMPV